MKEYFKYAYGSFIKATTNICINLIALTIIYVVTVVDPDSALSLPVAIFLILLIIGNAIGDYVSYKKLKKAEEKK